MRIFLLFFLLSFNSAYGQAIDCEKIFNQKPNFLNKSSKSSDSLFAEDVKILKHCGKFDDADSILLKGPSLGALMVNLANKGEIPSYGMIIKELRAIKNSVDYKDMVSLQELGSKKINLKTGSQDKLILLQMFEGSEEELQRFRDFINKNQHLSLTYKQAILLFMMSKGNMETSSSIQKPFEFKLLNSIESAMAEAKKANKKLLIFFTCYACINGVKMEEEVFVDSKVKSLLEQNYLCFKTYLDDRTELPITDQYFSKALNKKVKTIGEKFQDLQVSKFKSDMQPHFVILDTNGKLIKQLIGSEDKQKFLSFLQVK